MGILDLLIAAMLLLQSAFAIVGYLIWHEFKRLQSKVDNMSTHQIGCMSLFASKEGMQRVWDKLDDFGTRIAKLEGGQ